MNQLVIFAPLVVMLFSVVMTKETVGKHGYFTCLQLFCQNSAVFSDSLVLQKSQNLYQIMIIDVIHTWL